MSFTLISDPPGPEAKALAEKELRETEENVKKGIETLRKYVEGWWSYYFSQFKNKWNNIYSKLFQTKASFFHFIFAFIAKILFNFFLLYYRILYYFDIISDKKYTSSCIFTNSPFREQIFLSSHLFYQG